MTGGFLDIGGAIRAVPAQAVSVTGATAHLQVTREQFLGLPKVDHDRSQFLSNPQNVAAIDRVFGVNTTLNDTQPTPLLAFSSLRRSDAYSSRDGRVGYIDDVWISLNRDRAPFIEITPTLNPFELPGDTRYAIPMARLRPDRKDDRSYTFAISADELMSANPVTEAPGVQMVNNGFVGDQVLRVTVGTVDQSAHGAGQPTAASSSPATAANPKVAAAAQRVRQALDGNSTLRAANIRVTTNEDQVVLQGTVGNDSLRDQAEKSAEGAANGVDVENDLQVRNE